MRKAKEGVQNRSSTEILGVFFRDITDNGNRYLKNGKIRHKDKLKLDNKK